MTTAASDISIVLSGGTSNINPNLSLGGDPSSSPIPNGVLNNLFDNISSTEAFDGTEDYRCIYIFNDGDTTIWNAKVYISGSTVNGATIELGINESNETQRISITGTMTGGQLILSYKGRTFPLVYDSDLGIMSTELQKSIQNLTISSLSDEKFFKEVIVTAQSAANNTVIFDIKWSGKDGKRNFEKFEIAESGNQLVPLGTIIATLSVIQEGSPINTITGNTSAETNPPGGVGFYVPSENSPITIPFLAPSDGFPLWIKRSVPSGSSALELDGFTMRFAAESLEPMN